ncbi:VCBS repeat-containing protein [Clostridium bornimense]|uniref:FG-GAP repeat domain-containing protein n=1 Tax=Clostridium bornimense TaxID=1216932 RepID=UPI001C118AD7|nr:VCBS repeat-containing protein [Clostridium bornimense]MBU5317249.1 VCBS repeat-containing protein [Clostridium bornimense]
MKFKSEKLKMIGLPLACIILLFNFNLPVKASQIEKTRWTAHVSTALEKSDDNYEFQIGDYNKDGKEDLYIIKKRVSGRSELHVLNGADNYKSFLLHLILPIEETDSSVIFRLGDYNGDGIDDLFCIKKKVSGRTEVHVMDGSKNFSSFLLQKRLPIEETDENVDFQVGDYNKDGRADLYCIKKRVVGKTEVHVLNAATEYSQFLLQIRTALGEVGSEWEFGISDYNSDKVPDVYCINKQGESNTEVRVLDGGSAYQSFILNIPTVMEKTDENTKFLVGKGRFNIYPIKRKGATNTELHQIKLENDLSDNLVNNEVELGFNINTALEATNKNSVFAVGDYNRDTIQDLFIVKKSVGGRSELHILSGKSRYSSFSLHKVLPIEATDENSEFRVADYNGDGILDLYWIKKHAGNRTEVHVMDGSNNFQTFLLQIVLPIESTNLDSNFYVGDYNGDNVPDLCWLKKQAGGKTEVHILSGSEKYQRFLLQKVSALPSLSEDVEFGLNDYNGDGKIDLYCINKQGENGTELYILDGKNEYQSFLRKISTPMEKRDQNTQMVLVPNNKINIYAINRQGNSSTTIRQLRNIGAGDGLDFKYSEDRLGELSAKYESNGDPGTISTGYGDIGGKSYGAWQLASNMGSVDKFLSFLKTNNLSYYNELSQAKQSDGNKFGTNFDNAWRSIAKRDRAGFLELQRKYIKMTYYDVSAKLLKNYNFNIEEHSWALKNVLWSTAVQHGANGAVNIFRTVGLDRNERDLIIAIYDERSKVDKYFYSSSKEVQEAVKNRFEREKNDALEMLKQ